MVGEATAERHLTVADSHFDNKPVDMDLSVLLGKPPKMTREAMHAERTLSSFATKHISLKEAAERVLRLPGVADKTFLITIGDRSVTGLVARDQMVGQAVGPGRELRDLQAVAARLQPGDVVLVDGDATYPGDLLLRNDGAVFITHGPGSPAKERPGFAFVSVMQGMRQPVHCIA